MLTPQQIRFFGAFKGFEAISTEKPHVAFFRLAKDREWHSDSSIFRTLWLECLGYEFALWTENVNEASEIPQTLKKLNGENLEKLMKQLTIATGSSSGGQDAKPIDTPTTSSFGHGVTVRYFDTHEGFEPDNAAPLRKEFGRLAKQQGWVPSVANGSRYRTEFVRCCAEEFRYFSGDDNTKLEAWQKLCTDLGIALLPSLNKCRKALGGYFVNIFDYIDCKRAGKTIAPIFTSRKEFRKHTLGKNIFPKAAAKKNPFLSVLLERLFGGAGFSR